MLAYIILGAAFGITGLLFAVFFGRYAQQGVKLEEADQTIAALHDRLSDMEGTQERLVQRIQNLEAIVTTEAWDALQQEEQRALLHAPDPPEPTAEEKAAVLARRQRLG